jgi:histidinol phosphatase-like PHP family hydrolase
MKITSDWHIHSVNSCDGASLAVSDLIPEAEAAGILDFGLTDHIHTPYNLPDLVRSREEFLANQPSPRFHFGVEVSCVSQWEIEEVATGRYEAPVYGLREGGPAEGALAIGLTAEDLTELGIEYVVGGTHWPMYIEVKRETVIRDYHRQNMFLATHPLVDIVAHPWWWMGHWQDDRGDYTTKPWLDDFGHIPKAMHNEFAAAVIEHGTRVEINIAAMLLNPHYPRRFVQQYLDYLADLQSQGAVLCIGSDCHSVHYEIDFETAGEMLEDAGIKGEELWRLPPRDDMRIGDQLR